MALILSNLYALVVPLIRISGITILILHGTLIRNDIFILKRFPGYINIYELNEDSKNNCKYYYLYDSDNHSLFVLRIFVADWYADSEILISPNARWFLNRTIDIDFFLDNFRIFSIEDHFFKSEDEIFDSDDSPKFSILDICFSMNLTQRHHSYRLQFTDEYGKQYSYVWGVGQKYRDILE